jgi:polyferredoxin
MDQGKAVLRIREKTRELQTPNILGPIFTPKAILGGFLVLFWMSILGGFLVLFWTSILGTSVPGCSLTLNVLPVYVSGRWEPCLSVLGISGLNWPFVQGPPY